MENFSQNYNLNLYKTFCVVAENKSISKAAELLFVSRPMVSYSIKQLEKALDSKLFFRTSTGVVLTPEAEKLYSYAKKSLNNLKIGEDVFKDDKKLNSGHIYIGCNPALFDIFIYRYTKIFHKIYPNIQFHFFTNTGADFIQMLKEHKIDMIISKFASNDIINSFSKKKFAKVTNCFVCNKDFKFLSDKKNVSLEKLAKFPLLLLNNNSYERRYLENYFKEKDIILKPIMEFSNISSLTKLVKEGIGIGYAIRELIEEDLKAGTLFEITVKEISYTKDIGVIYDENHLTFAAKKFIDML